MLPPIFHSLKCKSLRNFLLSPQDRILHRPSKQTFTQANHQPNLPYQQTYEHKYKMKLTLQQAVYYPFLILLACLLKTSIADTPRLPPKNEREATTMMMANITTSGAVIGMEGMKLNGGPLGGGYGCKGRCSSGAASLGDGVWVGLLWVMVVLNMVVLGGRDVLRLWDW